MCMPTCHLHAHAIHVCIAGLGNAGYIEEKHTKVIIHNGIVQREPLPQLCYTHMGAVVPLQV